MIQLAAGQNTRLTADTLQFSAKADVALDVSALVVAPNFQVFDSDDFVFYNQPQAAGVRLTDDGIVVRLSEIRADARAVLLVVSVDPDAPPREYGLGTITATLAEKDSVLAEFVTTPAFGETALICLEVYRRGDEWKLRAVGQGYSGGLAVLLTAHGVEVEDASGQPTGGEYIGATTHSESQVLTAPNASFEVDHGLERLWMIFEDAARSAAALVSARDFAERRLDDELSAAVADPAVRNSPAAASARQAAQQRCDELIVIAERNHLTDSHQLMRELAAADRILPPALASWDAPTWDGPHAAADGIRLGELYAPDRGQLRVPYCVPVPLTRPLWIDSESSAAVAPVVGALLARLLAATPDRRTLLDIVDLSRAFTGLTELLAPALNGPPITEFGDISPRLQALADAAELAELAYTSGGFTPPMDHRVLLLADFPHGYVSSDIRRFAGLMVRGELIGLSTIIIGPDESDSDDATLAGLARSCRHLPTTGATPLFDPWTGSPWLLDLDILPREPGRQAKLLRHNH
ncbi:TerD family protein [Nocardia arthritidis]|uniref:Transporter n=1 Tax=Nocardia arthritidis TaxID=228602 RepID=A0A6G9YUA8_9NOCA|nr:TerD family protein [Nocardia arthritidis]QIS16730.1 transporter [Nocardia arthritidis]